MSGLSSYDAAASAAPIVTTFRDDSRAFSFKASSACPGCVEPLIIDNGSYELRAGFVQDSEPRLRVRSAVAKPRQKKGAGNNSDRVGAYIPPEDWYKDRFKSPFESNVVVNFSHMESMLDYTFSSLGISGDSVQHPLVITECLCNPSYSRAQMSEMLFEGYGAPSVCFGVGDLFAHSNAAAVDSSIHPDYGLVVGIGYETTHVVPIVAGLPLFSQSCRLSVGGFHVSDNLLKSLRLHNPHHTSLLYSARAEEFVHRFCYVSTSFASELEVYADRADPAITIQLPYESNKARAPSAEAQLEKIRRQKEQGLRLKQMAERRRAEKLEQQKLMLQSYEEVLNEHDTNAITQKQFLDRITRGGFTDEADFMSTYKDLKKKVAAQLKRLAGEGSSSDDEQQYALLEVPDEDLDESQKKEKRKQRLMKAGAEARERKRQEKEAELERQAELKREERRTFEEDSELFLANLRQKKQELIEKRAKRRRTKADLSDRRSAASKRRMRVIADMGTGTMEGSSFGADDADWDVYRKVSKKGGDETDSDSEEESAHMRHLSDLLREYDPEWEEQNKTVGSAAEHHQLYCSVQRIRQSEILFQPSMIGLDQIGLADAMKVVLSRLEPDVQQQVAQNVVVTGGPSQLPQLQTRLANELREMRPFRSPSRVFYSGDGSLDAWRGARNFAATDSQLHQFSVDRAAYDEFGANYFVQHRFGNPSLASRR